MLFLFSLNIGTWFILLRDPLPKHVDYLFTFGGEDARSIYSRELIEKYPKAFWFLSDYPGGLSRVYRDEQALKKRLLIIDTCSSTLSEVKLLKRLIKERKSKNETIYVGLVSGPYHMRRIQLLIYKVFLFSNVRFYFLPVPLERYEGWSVETLKTWWKNTQMRNVLISEIQKIWGSIFVW